jgi:hypothetical protein
MVDRRGQTRLDIKIRSGRPSWSTAAVYLDSIHILIRPRFGGRRI